jgi:hypothetical protein
MKTLVWILAWISVAIWSLVAWAGHGLLGFAGGMVADNADVAPVTPEGVELLSGLADWMTWAGQGAVVVVWAVGALAILGVAALVARLLRPRPPAPPRWIDAEYSRAVPASGHSDPRPAPGHRLAERVRAIADRRGREPRG